MAATRKITPAGPLGQANPAVIWTGRAIIDLDASIGGHGSQGPIRPDDMTLRDLATGRWLRLPARPDTPDRQPPHLAETTAVLVGCPIRDASIRDKWPKPRFCR
jgi:hypothetical protein